MSRIASIVDGYNLTLWNNSFNVSCSGYGRSTPSASGCSISSSNTKQLLLIFYSALLILTVLGNILVCAALCFDRKLRTPTNWFIVSLAVSDLFYACFSLPFRLARDQPMSIQACRFWIWTDMVCAAASIANLVVISFDRRLKITRPLTYTRDMRSSWAFSAIGSLWFYAILLASLSLVKWPGEKGIFVSRGGSCFNQNRIFYTVGVAVGFLFPLLILVLNYCHVYLAAFKQFRKISRTAIKANLESKHRRRRISQDFKATKTLAIVIGTFCFCWCPFFILFMIMQYKQTLLVEMGQPWNDIVFTSFILVLPNLNSMCNPIIYTFFNSEFRKCFWKVFLKLFRNGGRGQFNSYKSSYNVFLQTTRKRSETPNLYRLNSYRFNIYGNENELPVDVNVCKKDERELRAPLASV